MTHISLSDDKRPVKQYHQTFHSNQQQLSLTGSKRDW